MLYEFPNEYFFVMLSHANNGGIIEIGRNLTTVTILDDGDAGKLGFLHQKLQVPFKI